MKEDLAEEKEKSTEMASRFKGGSRKKESDYYDEEAIEDVDDAICEIKPLKEIKRLASRIRN